MKYHNILHCNMNNGPGLRVVLFVSGCGHHCKGCQNPQTWNPSGGIDFDDDALDEIFDELKQNYCQGITLTGGDPLYPGNRNDIYQLCECIKLLFPTKNIFLYTGYTWEELMQQDDAREILRYVDILADGRFEIDNLSPDKHWVGSSNQRIIDVQASFKESKIVLRDC